MKLYTVQKKEFLTNVDPTTGSITAIRQENLSSSQQGWFDTVAMPYSWMNEVFRAKTQLDFDSPLIWLFTEPVNFDVMDEKSNYLQFTFDIPDENINNFLFSDYETWEKALFDEPFEPSGNIFDIENSGTIQGVTHELDISWLESTSIPDGSNSTFI